MRAWLRYFEEVPTVTVRFPPFNQVFLKFYGAFPEEQFSSEAERRPLRKHFYQKMERAGFSERDIAQSLERMDDLGHSALWKDAPAFAGWLESARQFNQVCDADALAAAPDCRWGRTKPASTRSCQG
jgi:hypothetical protein